MKNRAKLLTFLLLYLLSSCRSSKELVYFDNASPESIISGLPVQTVEHLLRPGDILYISIKSMNPEVNILFNPESNMEVNTYGSHQKYTTPGGAYLYGFEIDAEGNIRLPMLGKINVAGVPQSQAEAIIQKTADQSLNDATVKVKLLNFKVTVLGEVRVPGIYYNYNNFMTVIDALGMANGNTDFASIKKVMVIRAVPDGNKPYMLDLSSKETYASPAFYLQPNDYVFVQPDRYKNFQLNSQAYTLVFSSLGILLAIAAIVFN
jgi:polysaccharide export outer membrane protein